MKKFLSFLFAFAILFSLSLPVSAATVEAETAANTLYALDLFYGTGNDADGNPIFDLDRSLTRQEAIVMLVRLLGSAEYALRESQTAPFSDVSDWAMPYIGYAYNNGLAKGISETTFGANDPITAEQFLTFVLRALGYSSATDFAWEDSLSFAESIGVLDKQDHFSVPFTRGDACIVCLSALSVPYKNSNASLLSFIQEAKAQDVSIADVLARAGIDSVPQQGATTSNESETEIETEPTSAIVYITKTGEKYHRAGCQYLRKSCIEITRASAIAQGYTACSRCKP